MRHYRIYINCALLGVLLALLIKMNQGNGIIYKTGSDVPDAAIVGNPALSETYASHLLLLYNSAHGDLSQIPLEEMQLPDQSLAENPAARNPNTTAWEFPSSPVLANVAFTTDIYERQNRVYKRGDRSEAQPTGFKIVVWKSGKIERVPVWALRVLSTPGGRITVWPGVPGYEGAEPHPLYSR